MRAVEKAAHFNGEPGRLRVDKVKVACAETVADLLLVVHMEDVVAKVLSVSVCVRERERVCVCVCMWKWNRGIEPHVNVVLRNAQLVTPIFRNCVILVYKSQENLVHAKCTLSPNRKKST